MIPFKLTPYDNTDPMSEDYGEPPLGSMKPDMDTKSFQDRQPVARTVDFAGVEAGAAADYAEARRTGGRKTSGGNVDVAANG